MLNQKPLCFVLMPFGKKSAGGTHPIDFDAVYRDVIKPAVEAAGLDPIRADEEEVGGIIHKPMFERLVLCDYAIADLTAANANVFYELGVRHAAKERTTILLFAEGHGRLPFDVAQLRALPYKITKKGLPKNADEISAALKERIEAAKRLMDRDSPLFQLLEDYPNVSHEKTDVFRERVAYSAEVKRRLADARKKGRDEIVEVEASLGEIHDLEAGIVIDLFLSYRAVKAWDDMVRIREAMNPIIGATVLVREQLALALNRAGRGEEAEAILRDLIAERGASSETMGILGRIYKDRWLKARVAGQDLRARGLLRQVIETYRKGFEADWRDAYPGINALTFMYIQNPDDPEIAEFEPVVEYALERKMDSDYWDYATKLELAILRGDRAAAEISFENALARLREVWEAETTLNNIQLITEAGRVDEAVRLWLLPIMEGLRAAAQGE
jgi:tetratricopeptide (TPR) repeat protein